jgi:hypothetical protein
MYAIQTMTATGWSTHFSLANTPINATANHFQQESHALRLVSDLRDLWPDAPLRVIRLDD